MRHLVSGRKLKRTSSHRKALLANLATELFRHKSIKTTLAKAKELRPYAESLITKAKNALLKERQGLLHEGQTVDVHSRRIVGRHIRVKEVLAELFDSIAPAVVERNGGYTRVIKTGIRHGDAGKTAIIELVDFAAPQDGLAELKKKRKPAAAKPSAESSTKKTSPKPAVETTVKKTSSKLAVETTVKKTKPVEKVAAVKEEVPEPIIEETIEVAEIEDTPSVDEVISETTEDSISEPVEPAAEKETPKAAAEEETPKAAAEKEIPKAAAEKETPKAADEENKD